MFDRSEGWLPHSAGLKSLFPKMLNSELVWTDDAFGQRMRPAIFYYNSDNSPRAFTTPSKYILTVDCRARYTSRG